MRLTPKQAAASIWELDRFWDDYMLANKCLNMLDRHGIQTIEDLSRVHPEQLCEFVPKSYVRHLSEAVRRLLECGDDFRRPSLKRPEDRGGQGRPSVEEMRRRFEEIMAS